MEEDFQTRRQQFIDGYKELIERTKCDTLPHPVYLPDPSGNWNVKIQNEIVDLTERPIPSPFQ